VQNNTYDVAFYGPNPLCGIYYLGALRAAEKMALAIEDKSSAAKYKDIYDRGSKWIEMNLFNGEFYTQQIKSYRPDQVYPALRRTPSADINNPDYQVGKGCLVDQLTGQYLAHVMNLGNLVSPKQILTTLQSIYKYNYRRSLAMHDNSARTYALDDEAALVICDYSTSTRPRIPFPYFAEVWSGLEHSTAALMIYCGMMDQGLECITNVRSRYDGEKRNPWNEAEYGHHYARPMAAWSSFIAVSGFHYDAPLGAIVAVPRVVHSTFRCFWSTGTGWGTFSYDPIGKNGTRFTLRVLAGKLRCSVCEITGMKGSTTARSGGQLRAHTLEVRHQRIAFRFDHPLELAEGGQLEFESNP
jgi:hypothetical protein